MNQPKATTVLSTTSLAAEFEARANADWRAATAGRGRVAIVIDHPGFAHATVFAGPRSLYVTIPLANIVANPERTSAELVSRSIESLGGGAALMALTHGRAIGEG